MEWNDEERRVGQENHYIHIYLRQCCCEQTTEKNVDLITFINERVKNEIVYCVLNDFVIISNTFIMVLAIALGHELN